MHTAVYPKRRDKSEFHTEIQCTQRVSHRDLKKHTASFHTENPKMHTAGFHTEILKMFFFKAHS